MLTREDKLLLLKVLDYYQKRVFCSGKEKRKAKEIQIKIQQTIRNEKTNKITNNIL